MAALSGLPPSSSPSSLSMSLVLPSLNDTFGSLLLGCFAGLISYGILIHQAYLYFRVYSGDQWINKAFVISILTMDTLQNVQIMHVCYTYLVSDYFEPLALLRGIWSIRVQAVMTGITVLICQSFYARRVYLLSSKHRVVVVFSLVLMLTMLGFSITGTVMAFRVDTFELYEHFYWIDSVALGAAVGADLLTAVILIVYLSRQRTPYAKTKTILNSLIVYTINTGLLTGIVNTLAIVFALVRPDAMIWIAIEFVGVRIYTNSVLAVLNSRQSLREAAARSGPNRPMDLELQSAPNPSTDERQSGSGFSGTPTKSTLVSWPSDTVIDIIEEHGS